MVNTIGLNRSMKKQWHGKWYPNSLFVGLLRQKE